MSHKDDWHEFLSFSPKYLVFADRGPVEGVYLETINMKNAPIRILITWIYGEAVVYFTQPEKPQNDMQQLYLAAVMLEEAATVVNDINRRIRDHDANTNT
jgi:hypothetical protein